MSLKDMFSIGGGLVFVVLCFVQISPIRLNPWSVIAKAIGNAINADMRDELSSIQEKLDSHLDEYERVNANVSRIRILRFGNELLRSIPHTKEEFTEVMRDIDAYERYCFDHPEYPNNQAVLTIENIKQNYKTRLEKHDFLQL